MLTVDFGDLLLTDSERARIEAARRDGDIEPCADCGDPVFWDADAYAWRHVAPARGACWLVHGSGSTLDSYAAGRA